MPLHEHDTCPRANQPTTNSQLSTLDSRLSTTDYRLPTLDYRLLGWPRASRFELHRHGDLFLLAHDCNRHLIVVSDVAQLADEIRARTDWRAVRLRDDIARFQQIGRASCRERV